MSAHHTRWVWHTSGPQVSAWAECATDLFRRYVLDFRNADALRTGGMHVVRGKTGCTAITNKFLKELLDGMHGRCATGPDHRRSMSQLRLKMPEFGIAIVDTFSFT